MPASGETCVSGVNVCTVRTTLVELIDAQQLREALDSLAEHERDAFESATAIGWVPVRVMEHVFMAVARVTDRDVVELQREVIQRGVERTLRTVWRVLMRFTSDEALIQRAPVMLAKTYNRGRISVTMPAPGHADISLNEFAGIGDFQLRSLAFGIETVLRISGRKDAQISWQRTVDGARFTGSWRP